MDFRVEQLKVWTEGALRLAAATPIVRPDTPREHLAASPFWLGPGYVNRRAARQHLHRLLDAPGTRKSVGPRHRAPGRGAGCFTLARPVGARPAAAV